VRIERKIYEDAELPSRAGKHILIDVADGYKKEHHSCGASGNPLTGTCVWIPRTRELKLSKKS
jgi:hypothetical protein